MSLHIRPPFRAEHIGSLKRPVELLNARAAFDENKISAEELKAVEDVAIADNIELQISTNIGSITDGEFRRHMFFDGFFNNIDGMQLLTNVSREMFMEYVPDLPAFFPSEDTKEATSYICKGKFVRSKSFYKSQFEYLQNFVPQEFRTHLKLTLCAPEWYHLRHGPHAYDKSVYSNDEEYFADITTAYQTELKELYELGCRNVQFDDPLLAYFCAESMIKGMEERGIDHEALLDLYIKTYNNCLKGKPDDLTSGLHLCRGNFKDGMHFSEGGYDRIAVKLFNELNVDCYYLEYDTERAGSFEPLKMLPKHKVVVLGIVSTKLTQLEDKAVMKARIYEAAEIMSQSTTVKRTKEEALNQLCISPQCGFASHFEGNRITIEIARTKLKLVAEVAEEVWGSN